MNDIWRQGEKEDRKYGQNKKSYFFIEFATTKVFYAAWPLPSHLTVPNFEYVYFILGSLSYVQLYH